MNKCANCGHDITHHTRRLFGRDLWMSGCDVMYADKSTVLSIVTCGCKKFEEVKNELYDTDGKRLR